MSAYIVEKKTIDRIVTYIKDATDMPVLKADIKLTCGINIDTIHGAILLGQLLWSMNYDAVNIRYSEKVKPAVYSYTPSPCDENEVLKSAKCLCYQCFEDAIPNTCLYAILQRLIIYLISGKTNREIPI